MGKAILTSGVAVIGGTSITDYSACATTPLIFTTTEARAQVPFRAAGTISRLYTTVTSQLAASTDATITLRKNGANGNNTVTIPQSASGAFEDTTNTDTIAAGDKVNYQYVEPNAAITYHVISVIFDATTNTVQVSSINSSAGVSVSGASITRWWPIAGTAATDGTTSEANISAEVTTAGTAKGLFFYVSANARTNNTVMQDYKTSANGSLTIVVGSGATGLFEDTTNSTTFAATDRLSLTTQTLSGTATLTYHLFGVQFQATGADSGLCTASVGNGSTLSASVTRYTPIGGAFVQNSTESRTQIKTRGTCTLTYLQARITSNSTTLTIRSRKNTANGNLVISVSSAATGLFTDTTNSDSCADTDNINVSWTTGAANPVATVSAINVKDLTIAATTNVSQTSIHKYGLRVNVAATTSIQKYNLRAYLAQTSIQKYRLGGLVLATIIAKYTIRKNLAQTFISKYNILKTVTATTSIHKYNLRKFIPQTIIHKYNMRTNIAQTSIHRYHVLSLFGPVPMTINATVNFFGRFLTKL